MSKRLHIISFDVPFPANYGGVIDVYYKIMALHRKGIQIHLHCFQYGRAVSPELESLCEKVYYYQRQTGLQQHFSLLPYTVKSRISESLRENLLKDSAAILFEVLHTCFLIKDPAFANRKKIYRHSNIEHDYYAGLSRSEKNPLKKIYLLLEAFKLKLFERTIRFADLILAVNQRDTLYFQKKYPAVRSVYLPSFHAAGIVTVEAGTGAYALFHGNLAVSENYEACMWLLKHVFPQVDTPVIIAGLNPPSFLRDEIAAHKHISLIESPSQEEMNRLIAGAQVHVLYTPQATGLKLKLLNVLFGGRFVVCNPQMIAGARVNANAGLIIADEANDYRKAILQYMKKPFTSALIQERSEMVKHFDNDSNADELISEIF